MKRKWFAIPMVLAIGAMILAGGCFPPVDEDADVFIRGKVLDLEALNKQFYRRIQEWFFWATQEVSFPVHSDADSQLLNRIGLIRLLTRLIFCWFIKEKGLVPETLFHHADLAHVLKDFAPESRKDSTYYHAILQNLFFATLNQRNKTEPPSGV